MEPKCFVNGCYQNVSFIWVLNSNWTYSCRSHKIEDKNEVIKCQEFKANKGKTYGYPEKLVLVCTAATIAFIIYSLGNFLLFQSDFLNKITLEIEEIKFQSDLNFKFYSEILTVKDILENNLDKKPRNDQKKPLEIYSSLKYSAKLNRKKTLLALYDKEVELQKKIELIVDNLGIVLLDQGSEVLSIAQISENEMMFGLINGTLVKLNLNSHVHEIAAQHKFRVYGINPTKDKSIVYITGDTQLNIWSPSLNKLIKVIPGHSHWVLGASISEDDKYLATGSCDKLVKIWDQFKIREISQFPGHTKDVWTVSFSRKNTYLASGGEDKQVLVWDIQSRSLKANLTGHLGPVYSISITIDLNHLISGSGDGTIKVWNLKTQEEEFSFEHKGMVRKILLVDDDRILLTVSGTSLKAWDFRKKVLIKEINHYANLISLQVTDDLKYIVTGDSLGRLWVWEFEFLDLLWVFGGVKSEIKWVEISEDFRYLAIADLGVIRIWDLDTGVQVNALRKHTGEWNGIFDSERFREYFR